MNAEGPRDQSPKIKNRSQIDWRNVRRVLVVRLRSIGDTVLATPSLIALKRFLPNAEIDILLEDWVAPLLEGHDAVDNIITIGKTFTEKLTTARELRKRKYDVVYNLHGGSTSTFLTSATGARHRVGYAGYRYAFLYTDLLSSSSDFWEQEFTHSAEQQLALLGHTAVPVKDRPRSRLVINDSALKSIESRLAAATKAETRAVASVPAKGRNATPSRSGHIEGRNATVMERAHYALLHPAAAFDTKTWPTENFARVAEYLEKNGLKTIAVAAKNETEVLEKLKATSTVPIITLNDLALPEITALASKATLFVGNDSGIAHIAAAVNTPAVVIFGSSNRNHWYPWTDAPSEIVFNQLPCQPCAGYECKEFGDPKCIQSVTVDQVTTAIDRVLGKTQKTPFLV
jgi:lipopolysaccharide heptosyltransferase II